MTFKIGPRARLVATFATMAALVATVDVAGLSPGRHTLAAEVRLPTGLTVVAGSPLVVTVTVTPAPTSSPSLTPTSSPSLAPPPSVVP